METAIYTYKIPASSAKDCAGKLKAAVGAEACRRGFGGKTEDGGMLFHAESETEKVICSEFGAVWTGKEYK